MHEVLAVGPSLISRFSKRFAFFGIFLYLKIFSVIFLSFMLLLMCFFLRGKLITHLTLFKPVNLRMLGTKLFLTYLLPISCRFCCRCTKSSLRTFRLPIVHQNKRHKDRSTIKNGSQKNGKQILKNFTITPTKCASVSMCQSGRNFPFPTQERLTFLLRTLMLAG